MLERYYSYRVCFICEKTGLCDHRELQVAIAEIEWLETHGPNKKPAQKEQKRQWRIVKRA